MTPFLLRSILPVLGICAITLPVQASQGQSQNSPFQGKVDGTQIIHTVLREGDFRFSLLNPQDKRKGEGKKSSEREKEKSKPQVDSPKSDCPTCKRGKDGGACEKCKQTTTAKGGCAECKEAKGGVCEKCKKSSPRPVDKMPELKRADNPRGPGSGKSMDNKRRDEMRKRFEEMRKKGGPWVENRGKQPTSPEKGKKPEGNSSDDVKKAQAALTKTKAELEKAEKSLHLAHKELGDKALQIKKLSDQVKNYQTQLDRTEKALAQLQQSTGGDARKLAATLALEQKRNEALRDEIKAVELRARQVVAAIQAEAKKRITQTDEKAKKAIAEAKSKAAHSDKPTSKKAPEPGKTESKPRAEAIKKPQPKKGTSKLQITQVEYKAKSAVNFPERDRVLKDVTAILKKNPDAKIKVIGHANDSQYEQANQEISENRAKFLASFLRVTGGFSKSSITHEAIGNQKPAKKGVPNRRVTFEISQ